MHLSAENLPALQMEAGLRSNSIETDTTSLGGIVVGIVTGIISGVSD